MTKTKDTPKPKPVSPKKAKPSSSEETEVVEQNWFSKAEPKDVFLSKHIGLNWYELMDAGIYRKKIHDGNEYENVEFKAKHLASADITRELLDVSPTEPIEGILSVAISVARKIHEAAAKLKLKQDELIGKIVLIQKTGTGKATRYPTVKLITPEKYYSED